MSLLSWLLAILAGLSLAVMVVSITVASRSGREARSTIFPIVREEEMVRAQRARIVTSVTGVIAAIMAGAFFLSGQLPALSLPDLSSLAESVSIVELPVATTGSPGVETQAPIPTAVIPPPPTEEQATPTSSQPAVVTPEPVSEETPTPSPTATFVPPTLIPTSTPIPTALPASPPAAPSPTAIRAAVQAPGKVELGPIAFATQITDGYQPMDSSTVFSNTVNRIYATFPFRGMRNGLTWTQIWYFDDAEFTRGEGVWQWGAEARSFVFAKPVGAGDYRLELYVDGDLVSSGEFRVSGPLGIGGPSIPRASVTPESPKGSVTPESP